MEEFGEIRSAILNFLKQERSATIAEIAARMSVTYEAVRQQLTLMETEGWVAKQVQRSERRGAGRPTSRYSLTTSGEHLFPKRYDLLAGELISSVARQFGHDAVKQLLASLTDSQVRKWEPLLQGKSLEERVESLRALYQREDPFMSVENTADGLRLVERNCPFLNVATEHPALCSLSVATLTRLLGFRVLREERFQSGDRRCVFRVLTDQPVTPDTYRFEIEMPKE